MGDIKERQAAEAISRMGTLKLMGRVIDSFRDERKLYLSEHDGYLRWLDDDELEKVKEYEEEYGNLVYHAILTRTTMGTMLSLLYVSKYEEDWDIEREIIKDGMAVAYVVNETYPEFSEAGTIGVSPLIGGLRRTF